MKKPIVLALILLLLMAFSSVCLQQVKAQYQGDITINIDGSVSPTSAPIVQSGNSYALTSDINGSITVNKSNIVLEGNKHTIKVPSVFSAGITLNYTSNSTVADFAINGGQYGINIYGTFNVVANNTISSVNNGIYSLDKPTGGIILAGYSNVISGNSLVNDLVGINFIGGLPNINCSYNLITGNTLTDCSVALLLYDSSNNNFYNNRFFNNERTVFDSGLGNYPQVISLNNWDNGYPSGGNFWSDYQTKYPYAKTIDSSGIGDTAYVINAQNKDRYPIMNLNQFLNFQNTAPKLTLLSPANQSYNESRVFLTFITDKAVNWTGYSLDGKQNVTIGGNSTIANLTNGIHGLTVYANDTFGNMGASQTINFSVVVTPIMKSEPFPTLPIAAVSVTLAAAVVATGLLVYHKKHQH